MKQIPKSADAKEERRFERIGQNLYRRGSGGLIYARVWADGKRTFRSTETDDPVVARKVLKKWRDDEVLKRHGIEPKIAALERNRLTVGKVIDVYIKAGHPTRKNKLKLATTVKREVSFLRVARAYFDERPAVTLTLADCDKYRDWRNSGGYVAKYTLRGNPAEKETRGGDRAVDLELTALGNALNLAVRRGMLKSNPITGRGRYTAAEDVRHCREVAPTPEGLQQIAYWLRARKEHAIADLVLFLGYSGLRIGEALPMDWEAVDAGQGILHVTREKKGVTPWVVILPEMDTLLNDMRKRATSHLLFPSPHDTSRPRDESAVRHRLTAACKALGIGHVTPHGLRSYFVTQARQSGLTDAEIAMLIGDKTGPSLIAQVYGDLRDDHLMKQAQRIRLHATGKDVEPMPERIPHVDTTCAARLEELQEVHGGSRNQ
ncbi:MAG TPA: site-specific integrase [Verrucomicrobiae bacterium]|nr:site-specific integrase [Verrucomicrobiae bacterium]